MNFLKGKKKRSSQSSFLRGNRPTVPPPPPPVDAGKDVFPETHSLTESISSDVSGSLSAGEHRSRNATTRARFYSDNDDDVTQRRISRFSGGKKERKHSSSSTSTFYISLNTEPTEGTVVASTDSSTESGTCTESQTTKDDKSGDVEHSHMASLPTIDQSSAGNKCQGVAPSIQEMRKLFSKTDTNSVDDEKRSKSGSRSPRPRRKLPKSPPDVSMVPPLKPNLVKRFEEICGRKMTVAVPGSEVTKSVSANDERGHDRGTPRDPICCTIDEDQDQLATPSIDTRHEADNAAHEAGDTPPSAPQRKKRIRRIKTLDCPPIGLFSTSIVPMALIDSDGMCTDSAASSTDSLDMLVNGKLRGSGDQRTTNNAENNSPVRPDRSKTTPGNKDVKTDIKTTPGNKDVKTDIKTTPGNKDVKTDIKTTPGNKDVKTDIKKNTPGNKDVKTDIKNKTGNKDVKTDIKNAEDVKTSSNVIHKSCDVSKAKENSESVSSDKSRRKLPDTPPTVHKLGLSGLPGTPRKPPILRPKPNFHVGRGIVKSFTVEDIDICQNSPTSSDQETSKCGATDRPSRPTRRKQKASDIVAGGDRNVKRRSRSAGNIYINPVLTPFNKPAVPKKPNLSSESLTTESQVKPPTTVKPLNILRSPPKPTHPKPTATKPKQRFSRPFSSLEELNQNGKQEGGNQLEKHSCLRDSYLLVKSTSLDSGLDEEQGDMLNANDLQTEQQNIKCDKNENVTSHKQLAVNESLELTADRVYQNVKQDVNSKARTQQLLRKVLQKVPRKESEQGHKQKHKSFRDHVYEDVDLQDDIEEGIKEEEEFGITSSDDDYSDDSFTDEEDIQFEQEQAKMLGLSPTKETDEAFPEAADPPKDKLFMIAQELLHTERTYMSKLHIIDQLFHRQVILENRQDHFLPENLIPQIFINIKSIYQFHDFLLTQLEERMVQWESVKKLGDVMMRWAPYLKLYTEYINKFDQAMETFNLCLDKYPRFAAIVEKIQAMPECGMLTLQHHMLEPIQRVPRYKLLLTDYLKHLPEDSLDCEDTRKALSLVSTAADHANTEIKKTELAEKLLHLSENIIGASSLNLISPTRELIKEGSITKISARDGSYSERYLFLFNDCLLICVPVTLAKIIKQDYKVKFKLDIEGMRVMEGDDLYTPNTFLIKSKTKSIEFHTSSAEVKEGWQMALWTVIWDYKEKKMSRMVDPSLTETLDNDELGKRAPTWIKDQATSMCMLCAREFTTFFRRHHCRACGTVVCGVCSARKTRLAYDGDKHNRVCDNCYNTLELKIDPNLIKSRGQQRKEQTVRGVKANDLSLICGYLFMSQDAKHWEKRYFAVRDNFTLYSYKAHQDLFALTSLPLPGYIVHRTKDENHLKGKFVFKLFHIGLKKEYYFQADDIATLDRWLSVLEKLVCAELPEMPVTTPTTTQSTVPLPT